MNDRDCVQFLQDVLPDLHMRWAGFRKVRRQVCKRIQRRWVQLGLADVQAYCNYLAAQPDEWSVLDGFCRITISRFYRDHGVFRCLEQTVFPELIQSSRRQGRRTMQVWSAGCASGEEPFTVALIWKFSLGLLFPDIKLHILATDADAVMIRRAQRGCYSPGALRDLPASWRQQAFQRNNGVCCLQARYGQGVEIMKHDVRNGAPDGPFDLVLCRNLVFTYFDEQLACELGSTFREGLRAGGGLVIGAHERLPVGLRGFDRWGPCPGIYRRELVA